MRGRRLPPVVTHACCRALRTGRRREAAGCAQAAKELEAELKRQESKNESKEDKAWLLDLSKI